jgi:hypothetical protein
MNQFRYRLGTRLVVALLITGILTFSLGALSPQAAYAETDESVNATLGHFAPFSDSPDRGKVDVWIDDVLVADDLPYLGQVQNVMLEAGTHQIDVTPTEWEDGAFTQTIEVPAPGSSSLDDPGVLLAINGGTSDIWLNVAVQPIEQSPPATGAKVRFFQLAPYALNGDSEYNVCNEDGSIFFGMTMVKFGVLNEYTTVPSGSYQLYLTGSHNAGCSGSKLTPMMTMQLAESSVGDFIAVGTNEPPPSKEVPPFPIGLEMVTVETQATSSSIILDDLAYLPLMVQP